MKKLIMAVVVAFSMAMPANAFVNTGPPGLPTDVPSIPAIDGEAVKAFYGCLFFGKCAENE
jgi:hypothetical protein